MRKLLCLLSLFAAVRMFAVAPVPYTEGTTFSFQISGTGSGTMTIYDENGSPSVSTSASGSTVESDTSTAWLRPGKTYALNFSASGPTNYWLSFIAPTGYAVYVDGVATDLVAQSPGGGSYSNDYTLEIRPIGSLGGGAWGSFSGIAIGKSITWEVGLGDLRTGRSAGSILFKEFDLSNSPSSRARLYYATPPANVGQIVVIYDGPSNQTLRQICTPIGFTDLVDVTNGYEIRFYTWSQAGWNGTLYTFTGSPWKTISVISSTANQLTITETQGSVVHVSSLTASGTFTGGGTGGTITTSGGYTIHTFNSSGTFAIGSGISADYLAVGGGGGGGSYSSNAGGGGAGSLQYLTSQSLSAGSYSVVVGGGGAVDTNGSNSTFNGTTAYGGGHGGNNGGGGASGGSGGGGVVNNNTGSPGSGGSGSNVNAGGSGDNGTHGWPAGGGGGAGAAGGGLSLGTFNGGNGITNSITGTAVYYCGGGGGGTIGGSADLGGLGGGGAGGYNSNGVAGTANTGGGGGGGAYGGYSGGSGGSGVVIVRYPTPSGSWTLQEGDGTTWLRTTTHTSSVPSAGQRDDVVLVRTGGTSGTIVAKTKYHYVMQAWGEELDSVIADPDTAALTTSYVYYTTSTDKGNYRKIQSVTMPTGGWIAYQYYDDWDRRGQLKYQYQPWLDLPSSASSASATTGLVYYYEYTADRTGRYTRPTLREERVNNTVTGKTTWSHGDVTGSGEPRAYMTINSYRDASDYKTDYTEAYRADADPDFAGHLYQSQGANLVQVSGSVSRGTFNTSTKAFTVGSSGDHWRELSFHGSTSSTGADSVTSFNSQSCPAVYMIPNRSTLDVTVRIAQGYVYRTETWVYTGSGAFSLMTSEDFEYDAYGHLSQRWASNGALSSYTYTDGRLTSTTDPTGIETQFTYDLVGRVTTSIKKGAAAGTYAAQGDITSTYTYDGLDHVTQVVVSGGALSQTTTSTYDLASRLTQSVTPGSYTTSLAYGSGGRVVTITLPGGATKIAEVYPDGQSKSLSGTGIVNEGFAYWLGSDGSKAISRYTGDTWHIVYLDWTGNKANEWWPGGDGTNYAQYYGYTSGGQLASVWYSDGRASHYYQYDTLGMLTREGDDLNGNGVLDLSSSDRIIDHASTFFTSSSNWWRRDTTSTYATASSSTATQVSKVETQLGGFSAAGGGYTRLARTDSYDIFGNVTTTYTEVASYGKMAVTTTVAPNSSINPVQTAYNGLLVSSKDTAGVTMTYGYDALGRQITSTDPRTGTTTTAYVSGTSQVYTVTDPASIVQATYTYDSAGRVATVTNALSKVCRYEYTSRNEKYHVWGDTDYPVEYAYDSYGRQTTMKTYRGGSGWTGSTWPTSTAGTVDTTTWAYQSSTGNILSKTDASGKVVSYTYNRTNQLATRQWARTISGTPITTTYSYDSSTRELTGVSYNDSLTPSLTYTYNRLGQAATVADIAGTRTFNYNLSGTLELSSEDLPSYFNTRRISYGYDTTGSGTKGRPISLGLGTSSNSTANQTVTYGYDGYGRINSVAANASGYTSYTYGYSYASNSNLVASVTNSTLSYTDTRTYDAFHDWTDNRTTTISSTTKAAFAYSQDNMGRTTQVAKTGELYNRYGNGTEGLTTYYGYDDLSQLTSEVTKVGTGSTVLTGRNDSAYAYDSIGNRSSRTHNSNSVNYTANSLNQYTQRDVTGVFDVAGAAGSGTTVTVTRSGGGTDTAARHGQYFFDGYSVTNTSNPLFYTLTVSDGTTNTNVPAYIAKTAEPFSYDDDGNLLSDGRWNYIYDAENRLLTMETIPAAVTAGVTRQKLTFAYDYLGRRVSKVVQSGWTGSSYANTDLSRRFIYNGWNLMAELDHLSSDAIVSSHFWGLDLAGPGQTTGGIGALLMTQEGSNSYLPVYDGNGNVHGMITAGSVTLGGTSYSAGDIVAAYEYDAFGNTLRESGGYATTNPFQYSTKFTDMETGLIYYGLRYYSPSLGRFVNRDPIGEAGGLNLYGFCQNNAVGLYDILGLDWTVQQLYSVVTYGLYQTSGGVVVVPISSRSYIATATLSDWNGTSGGVLLSTSLGGGSGIIIRQSAPGTVTFSASNGSITYREPITQTSTPPTSAPPASDPTPTNPTSPPPSSDPTTTTYTEPTAPTITAPVHTTPSVVMSYSTPGTDFGRDFQAPNNAGGGGYWPQVGRYFGNYMLGVAESPWTLLKGVGRGYTEIGGLLADATTGQFWSDVGRMTTNPGATAASTLSVGADIVSNTVASFEDGRNLGNFVGGAAIGSVALPGTLSTLSNASKGAIGEATSLVTNLARGNVPLGGEGVGWQVVIRAGGRSPVIDWQFKNVFTGSVTLVESKFGTAGLTSAQRAAAPLLSVEKWTYPFWSKVGAAGGAAGGTTGSGRGP